MVRELSHYIDGQRVEGTSGRFSDVYDPCTGEVQARLPLASTDNVRYDDVRIDANGQAVAVGAGGTIAHIAADGSVVMQHIGTADLHTIHIAAVGDDYESVGFAAGEGGQIWITRDGGWSWSEGPNAGATVFGVDAIGDGHR